jgi:hypothetical protein
MAFETGHSKQSDFSPLSISRCVTLIFISMEPESKALEFSTSHPKIEGLYVRAEARKE